LALSGYLHVPIGDNIPLGGLLGPIPALAARAVLLRAGVGALSGAGWARGPRARSTRQ
jgi:hypothetical protein